MDIFFLFAIVLTLFQSCQGKAELLHFSSGEVGQGNFTYYSLMYTGFISLRLTSNAGDCDLYISQHSLKPTYETDAHCLQSATCGVDSVIIPKSFRRPIGIGIFGHPSHEACSYTLHFYRVNKFSDEFTDELSLTAYDYDDKPAYQETRSSPKDGYSNEDSYFWYPMLLSLLEFSFEIIFA